MMLIRLSDAIWKIVRKRHVRSQGKARSWLAESKLFQHVLDRMKENILSPGQRLHTWKVSAYVWWNISTYLFFFCTNSEISSKKNLVELCFKHLWPTEKFVDFEEFSSKQVNNSARSRTGGALPKKNAKSSLSPPPPPKLWSRESRPVLNLLRLQLFEIDEFLS